MYLPHKICKAEQVCQPILKIVKKIASLKNMSNLRQFYKNVISMSMISIFTSLTYFFNYVSDDFLFGLIIDVYDV